jgi:hypothetical protein
VKPDRAEIRRALNALTVAGQTFEIRAIDVKVGDKLVAKSRVCHTVAAGVAAAVESWTARGTYFTLNPLKPDLKKNAADADVLRRHLLLTDIDAVRGMTGAQNATDAEKQSAIELGYMIRDFLLGLGWPRPIVIDSGNGCHLLHWIELPNDDESRDLVKSVLAELARRFDNDAAKVDTGVFNAARISKLPGTVVRKGPATAERPHRVGRLIDVPAGREIVTRGMLAAIAGKPPAGDEKPAGERRTTKTPVPSSLSIENRVIAYIRTIDPAVSGQAGHDTTFGAACRVGPGFDLPPDVAFRLRMDEYNPRCLPPWSEAELRHKVDDAYKVESRRGWLLDERPPASNGNGNGHGHGLPASLNGHWPSPPTNGHAGNGDGHTVPQIEVSSKRHAVLAETIKAIVKDEDLYCRGETLGIVFQEQDDTAALAGGVELAHARGNLRFIPLAQSVLGCRLTRCASFYRWSIDRNGEATAVDCHPPDWLISAVTDHRYWPGVRELLSIAEVPCVLADGSMTSPGFDRRTGTLYRSLIAIPALPDRPTLADAKDARDRIYDLVSQFPFEDGNSFAAWLANLLTAIQRPLIRGPVPGFAYNGNKAGCGKGLLIDIIGNIVWGCDVSTRTYPMDPNEADKVKLALALAAVPMVHFDNLPEGGFYGGSTIDSALTSTITSGRILGLSRDSGNVPIRPVWTLSGNNVSPTGDADRRWLPVDLVTNEENPHERSDIEHKDLRGYVLEHRAELLRDCHLILKAHALEGRPSGGWGALGSYEEWDLIVRGAVWYATGIDCLTTQRRRAKEMPDRISKTALLEGWKQLDLAGEGKTVQEALEAVESDPIRYATLKSAFLSLSKDGKLPSVTRIGNKLRAMRKTPISRMRFEKSGETRDGSVVWMVVQA